MICKKCGREFSDDMPKCLWCSAPNEGYDKEDVPQDWGVENDEDDPDALGGDKHPAGNFMWSAALGGPIFSTLVHYKKLRGPRFFVVLVIINVLIKVGKRFLDNCVDWSEYSLLALPVCVGVWLIHICVMGKAGAWQLKIDAPTYNVHDYHRREKWGVILGFIYIVVFIFIDILFALKGMSL